MFLKLSTNKSSLFTEEWSGTYLKSPFCWISLMFMLNQTLQSMLLLSHFSRVQLCVTPDMAAHQATPSLGFSRQEHWSGLPFPSPMHESEKWKGSRSVMSDCSRPHGLQPTRLLYPWDFPGKSTGVGCHCNLWMLCNLDRLTTNFSTLLVLSLFLIWNSPISLSAFLFITMVTEYLMRLLILSHQLQWDIKPYLQF